MNKVDPAGYLSQRKLLVERALEERLPSAEAEPRHIHAAMRYAALRGGKRLRPMLVLEVGAMADGEPERFLDAACALEFVHTASLVLDDLPSMDNAALRRGEPTTHTVYGEATAVLASMGFVAMAFELVARNAEALGHPERAAGAVRVLAEAIGPAGIIHGQHVDLGLVSDRASLERLEDIYGRKAGALFVAAVGIPAYLAGMGAEEKDALHRYAMNVGLTLQITDDLLDVRDAADRDKTTFATHLGVEGARHKAGELACEAAAALEVFGERAEPLRRLAEYLQTRTV
jgi:geranylgeranyl diphosphate synthase type II